MVNISVWIMNGLSLPIFNKVVGTGCLLGMGVFLTVIVLQIRKDRQFLKQKLVYLFLTLLFIVIHSRVMFEMNIEIIHSIEFSLLAYLLFALSRSVGFAIVFALPVMLLDEWNQYILLYPEYVMYYEFNDIVMDILGSGLALVTLSVFGIYPKCSNKSLWAKPEILFLFGLLTVTALAINSGYLAQYISTQNSNTVFAFNKMQNPDNFWTIHSFTKARYHIMGPVEGITVIVMLCLFYAVWDNLIQDSELKEE